MTSRNPHLAPVYTSSARPINDIFGNLGLSDLARGLQASSNIPMAGMPPIRNQVSANGLYGRPAYDRQNGREQGGHRGKSQKSRAEYQFWPQGVAMGSQIGKKFIQVGTVTCSVVRRGWTNC